MVERELEALDRGAVDFVDKARGVEVLERRLRVIVARQPGHAVTTMPETERHGELTLHSVMARALWQQKDVGLTITEYKIVRRLVSYKGEVQTYRAIYDTAHYKGFVAGSGDHGYKTNVRSLMKRIRRKFLAVDPSFAEIENVQTFGYRWRSCKS